MEELIKLDSVDTYNKLFGLETLHPMVSVIDCQRQPYGRNTSKSIMECMPYF